MDSIDADSARRRRTQDGGIADGCMPEGDILGLRDRMVADVATLRSKRPDLKIELLCECLRGHFDGIDQSVGRLTPSWTPLPLSPLPPRHNPPPSPHLADPRFAAAEPTVRPSPSPPQQTDPEPQSPSWTSHTSSFGNISTACSIRFPKICPIWEPQLLRMSELTVIAMQR